MDLLQNEMFTSVSGSLTALFICMAAGFLARRLRIINDEVSAGMTSILVKITLPCTVFMSMQRQFSRTLLYESLLMLIISFIFYSSGICIGALLSKLLKACPDEKSIWQFALIFSNVGYMGFPVMMAVYGEESLIYTSMANVSFNLLAFTIGIKVIASGSGHHEAAEVNAKTILFNPAIIVTVLGFIFFIFSLSLPTPVKTGVSMMGNMTSPLSMLVVGGILAKSDFSQTFRGRKMYAVIFFRLIVIPIAALLILKPLINNRMMLGVMVFLLAMPVASLTAIFAEQYKGNSGLASRLVFVSTLFSLVTLPLLSLLL